MTYKVKPINNISDIPKGTFDWVYDFITDQTVPLKHLTEEKDITLLELHETIESDQLDGWLQNQGAPIEPNYLLGLAVQYPEAFEAGKDYISSASVFQGKDGYRCFLGVDRRDGKLKLSLVRLDGDWRAGNDWVFLADTSKPNSLPLSLASFDTRLKKVEEFISKLKNL